MLRLQPFPKHAGYSQHFGLLCLVSGGSGPTFEREALVEHVGVWLRLLARLGVEGADVRVRVSSSTGHASADDVAALTNAHPSLAVAVDDAREQGRAYYAGPMLGIDARMPDMAPGTFMTPADGGAVAWTRDLVSDGKERLFTSGFGLELIVKRLPVVVPPRAPGPGPR